MLAQDDEPGFEGGVGEAYSTVTTTRSKRDRRNQRMRREQAAKDLQIVDLTEQNAKLSEQVQLLSDEIKRLKKLPDPPTVSYTHLRAHETPEHLVCRLLLEKKKKYK